MGKFDFEEMDSAMQNAESKSQYEQQTELLNRNIKLVQELHEKLGIYIEETSFLIQGYKSLIADLNNASTIKCPSNLKSLLDDYANEVCRYVIKMMNAEATKIVKRIETSGNKKTISDSLFYVLWIASILFVAFFVTLCYMNCALFHLDVLWQAMLVFGVMTVCTLGIALYLTRK